ncbi:MAG: hypothetical protein N3E52_04200 [Candidatus Bathyarchaeota archaeon]|nr:hypothetical protein [Candidatus Bathyarchaeota archaeon]
MSKYSSLAKYLSSTGTEVALSFSQIENVLGFPLPSSARKLRCWWANDFTHSQAKAGWLAAGYIVDAVDLKSEIVRFRPQVWLPVKKEEMPLERQIKKKVAEILEKRYGKLLTDVRLGERVFDFVSSKYDAVGELLIIRSIGASASYFINIPGHLWYLEKIDVPKKFMVFYGDRNVPEKWLNRFGHMIKNTNIRLYFFKDDKIEELLL